jgi:signal transduction histidine kinase
MRGVRQPRSRLVAALLVTSVLVSLVIAGFGWWVLHSQSELDARRQRERVDAASDAMAASIRTRLAEAGERLNALLVNAGSSHDFDDAVTVARRAGEIVVNPDGALPFLPAALLPLPADESLFAEAEIAEHAGRRADAIGRYKELEKLPSPSVRAGALWRWARAAKASGHLPQAKGIYERLAASGEVPIGLSSVPASLLGLEGQRMVATAEARPAEAERLAAAIVAGIDEGRWRIDRGTADFYREMLADSPPPVSWALATGLADTVGALGAATAPRGMRVVEADGRTVLVMWRAQQADVAWLIAFADRFIAPESPLPPVARWLLMANDASVATDPQTTAGAVSRVVGADDGSFMLHVWPDPDAHAAGARPAPILWLTGALIGCLWIATAFMTRAIRREARVAQLQSDFVAAVSHEFRSPLTTMRQMAEMLESDRVTVPERRREYYGVLAAEAARLQRLVETLLDFGRMEAGRHGSRRSPVDVGELVADVAAGVESQARTAGMSIVMEPAGQRLTIDANPDELRLALRNLVENAIKYSPGQPEVRVRLRRDRDGVAIDVVDRGLGIAASERRAIFGKFVRGRAAGEAHVKGTGVGLAMARHVARAHGGDVTVDSEPGRGSTFTLRLPTT